MTWAGDLLTSYTAQENLESSPFSGDNLGWSNCSSQRIPNMPGFVYYFSTSLRLSFAPEKSKSSQGNCYRSCPVSAWPNCGTASATTSLTNCHPGVSHVPKTAMLSHCFHDVSSPQNASLAKRCMPQGFQCGVSRIRTTPTYFQNWLLVPKRAKKKESC